MILTVRNDHQISTIEYQKLRGVNPYEKALKRGGGYVLTDFIWQIPHTGLSSGRYPGIFLACIPTICAKREMHQFPLATISSLSVSKDRHLLIACIKRGSDPCQYLPFDSLRRALDTNWPQVELCKEVHELHM